MAECHIAVPSRFAHLEPLRSRCRSPRRGAFSPRASPVLGQIRPDPARKPTALPRPDGGETARSARKRPRGGVARRNKTGDTRSPAKRIAGAYSCVLSQFPIISVIRNEKGSRAMGNVPGRLGFSPTRRTPDSPEKRVSNRKRNRSHRGRSHHRAGRRSSTPGEVPGGRAVGARSEVMATRSVVRPDRGRLRLGKTGGRVRGDGVSSRRPL